jgi:hypothetical protein
MANGKHPRTTGEHLVALYGHVEGFKKDIKHLHEDVNKIDRKTDRMIYYIIAGAGTTILTLIGLFNVFLK